MRLHTIQRIASFLFNFAPRQRILQLQNNKKKVQLLCSLLHFFQPDWYGRKGIIKNDHNNIYLCEKHVHM